MRTHPEGDPPRAAHSPAGRGPAPQDEARAAFAGDAGQVGADAELAQVALGIDQPVVGQDRPDRGACVSPVVSRVAVWITSPHTTLRKRRRAAPVSAAFLLGASARDAVARCLSARPPHPPQIDARRLLQDGVGGGAFDLGQQCAQAGAAVGAGQVQAAQGLEQTGGGVGV